MILPVAVVVILVIVFVQKGKGSSEPVQEVETAKAEKGNITAELETSGTIGSEDMRTYSSPVNAEIATADLQVGKPVKKGEICWRIVFWLAPQISIITSSPGPRR